MAVHTEPGQGSIPRITKMEINRVLDAGRLLLSVLTQEELAQLSDAIRQDKLPMPVPEAEIHNTGES